MQRIGIIDYGMGNLTSVYNAFTALGCRAKILGTPNEIADVTHLVLPGVGAFADGIKNLHDRNWIPSMNAAVLERRLPFLGICLGMQLLATRGSEHGWHDGLGWISGEVLRLSDANGTVRIPHVGWNDVAPVHANGNYHDGRETPGVFYFVHSYHLVPDDISVVDGRCEHGEVFVASVWKDNIYAVQFHPEKSQHCGLQILRNFLARSHSQ